jgi:nitroreductase
MTVADAIRLRRTHKDFTERAVERSELEAMLDAAVLAPNHRLTEPWRFIVLGPDAGQAVAGIRARVKCGPAVPDEDEEVAARRARIVHRSLAIPAMIAVAMHEDDDATRRDEDYAATFMGIQNMLLVATSLGLGTKISTGPVLEDAELRALLRAGDRERVVALIHVGEPVGQRAQTLRTAAREKTLWLD